MKRLLLVALGMALLLALASAPPAAAYGGESSATMSCRDNTSTMTRTVIVTITWHAVKDGGSLRWIPRLMRPVPQTF